MVQLAKKKKIPLDEIIENKRKEYISIAYLWTICAEKCSKLEFLGQSNDKGVSFDGAINVFTEEVQKVGTLDTDIKIQVKSKQFPSKEGFPNKKFKFSLERAHLNNYLSAGGVLFVVVAIVNNNGKLKKALYVRALPTLDLEELLEQNDKNNITFNVYEIETDEFEGLCINFSNKKKAQPGLRNIVWGRNQTQIEDLVYVDILSHGKNQNLFENSYYLSNDKNLNMMLKKVDVEKFISNCPQTLLEIGKEKYTFDIIFITEKTENIVKNTLIIEDILEISFSDKEKFNVTNNSFVSLEKQLKIAKMMELFFEKKSLSINLSVPLTLKVTNHTHNNIKQILFELEELEKFYNYMSIPKNIEISGSYIEVSKKLLYLKKQMKSSQNKISETIFLSYEINNVNILIYSGFEGTNLLAPFSEEVLNTKIRIKNIDINSQDEVFPNIYICSSKHFFGFANIDYQKLKKSFCDIHNVGKEGYEITMEFILNALLKYDELKDTRILDFAHYLSKKTLKITISDDFSEIQRKINYFQCIIRTRKINKHELKEIEKLYGLSNNIENSIYADFCIDLLLGKETEAKKKYYSMDDEFKNLINSTPIGHIFQNSIE